MAWFSLFSFAFTANYITASFVLIRNMIFSAFGIAKDREFTAVWGGVHVGYLVSDSRQFFRDRTNKIIFPPCLSSCKTARPKSTKLYA